MANEVVFADRDVTLHVLAGGPNAEPAKDQFGRESYDVRSQTLLPGQSVSVDEVPPYVLEAVKADRIEGLSVMSEKQAQKLLSEAERLRGLVAPVAEQYGAGWDQSHSDWLVPDSVRIAQLAARGEAEAGDGDDALGGQMPPKVAAELEASAAAESVALSDDSGENVSEDVAAAPQVDDTESGTPSGKAAKKAAKDDK